MVYGDSNLVIQQMFGNWQIKEGIYAPFAQRAKILRKEFSHMGWQWIPRRENAIADELSKALLKEGLTACVASLVLIKVCLARE